MRVVVTGASGNAGTSVLGALAQAPEIESILGLARRRPDVGFDKTEWRATDITRGGLEDAFRGADAVVHLAWLIQPSRDRMATGAVNVDGSRRVFDAAVRAGVPALVHASSVGTYAPGPKDRRVDESWPATGIPTSFYARDKARCERMLDELETEHPRLRVVRLRPGLIFKAQAAAAIRRLFVGPLLPNRLVRPGLLPALPLPEALCIQAVHADDVASAYLEAVRREVHGAFNIAAEPVLDPPTLARALGARHVAFPASVLRGLAALSWRARLQPTPPGWLDLALGVPLMDCSRAREELGWEPERSSDDALRELVEGLRTGEGGPTPPLERRAGGILRWRELLTGVGGRG